MKPVAIPATYASSSPSNKAYKRSWREKITPAPGVSLKAKKTPGSGKASAAVAVKDLRPLRGARARASLTAILAAAGTPPMAACRSLSL